MKDCKSMNSVGWVRVEEYEPNGARGDLCLVARDVNNGSDPRIRLGAYYGKPGMWSCLESGQAISPEYVDWIMIIPPVGDATYCYESVMDEVVGDIGESTDMASESQDKFKRWVGGYCVVGCLVPLLIVCGTLIMITNIIWG